MDEEEFSTLADTHTGASKFRKMPVRDLFRPHRLSVWLPECHGLVASNYRAGDQGVLSVVDDLRSDHLDLVAFAKAQVVAAKKPLGGNVHLEGAVLRFQHQVSSFIPADGAVELLHVLHHALHGHLIGSVVSGGTLHWAVGEQQNHENKQCAAHNHLWNFHSAPPLGRLDTAPLPQAAEAPVPLVRFATLGSSNSSRPACSSTTAPSGSTSVGRSISRKIWSGYQSVDSAIPPSGCLVGISFLPRIATRLGSMLIWISFSPKPRTLARRLSRSSR